MKKILISLGVIGAVAAIAIGGSMALFNDTETSVGNIFTAGSIDLKVDHTLATYNGGACVSHCDEAGSDLIVNGGFEDPTVTANGGQWQTYSAIPGWVAESGPGIELQRNSVAGAPHGGVQLAELDSDGSSSMSQTLITAPGGKYRLHFFYSPRPNIPAGDNTIGFNVKVVGDNSVIVNDTVGLDAAGGGNTVWTGYVYDFIAVDASTKVVFTDLGSITNNMMGGYIDDVSMFTLNCIETGFPNGGICHLWNEKDLVGATDQFWNFPDVKPGDHGTDVVSLHVDSNDAYACLFANNIVDTDITLTGPETSLGDTLATGELSPLIKVFGWDDVNVNGVYDSGEAILISVNTSLPSMLTQMIALSLTGGGPTKSVGLAWCGGTQTLVGTTISCDGSGMGNIAQTDSTTLDFTAYAVQQRNNSNFTCASVNIPTQGGEQALGPAKVNLLSAEGFAIIAKTAITDATPAGSAITGDIGIDPAAGSAITDVSCTNVTGMIHNDGGYTGGYNANTACEVIDPGPMLTARLAMETAYGDAAGRTPGVGATNLNVGGGTLNGQNFVPGTYTWNTPGNVTITGDITLTGDANDVWIFQITGTLNTSPAGDLASGVKINLAGGADAKNVFWQVVGATTLGTYSTFNGTILDQTNIAIQTGAKLNGRALAQTAVTLDANTVTKP